MRKNGLFQPFFKLPNEKSRQMQLVKKRFFDAKRTVKNKIADEFGAKHGRTKPARAVSGAYVDVWHVFWMRIGLAFRPKQRFVTIFVKILIIKSPDERKSVAAIAAVAYF